MAVKKTTAAAVETKAAAKTETAVKPVEKKAPARKAPAKKTTSAKTTAAAAEKTVKTSLYVQFAGKEFTENELIESAKKAYEALGNTVSDIKTLEVYVKPEESAAYYVVNGVGSDDFKIEL